VNRLMPRALAGSLLVLSVTLVNLPAPAVAAGGGGGGDGIRNSQPAKAEDAEYTAAVKAIKAEDYPSAIRLLQRVVARDGQNADAYNWLAYATRKAGDAAAAIPIYEKALAINPKHRGAHEYIGEAYLVLGDLPKAKQHLKTLDGLCFFSCEEYRDLKKAVESYEQSAGSVKPTSLR
jgi:tetratricopeptide (TPR) repeat protein